MKKIRIFFTALTVLAVVGGALAFKAHNTYNGGVFCTNLNSSTGCTIPNYTYTESSDPDAIRLNCSTESGGTCAATSVKILF